MSELSEENQKFFDELDQEVEKQCQIMNYEQTCIKEENVKLKKELKRCYNSMEDLKEKVRKLEQKVIELESSKEKEPHENAMQVVQQRDVTPEIVQMDQQEVNPEEILVDQQGNENISKELSKRDDKKRKRDINVVEHVNKKLKVNEERNKELNQIIEMLNKPLKEVQKIKIFQPKERENLSELFNDISKLKETHNVAAIHIIEGYYNLGKMMIKQETQLRKKSIGKRETRIRIIDEIEKELKLSREIIKKRVNKAERMFHLFNKIGKKKINNIKARMGTKIQNLKEDEIEFIIRNVKC